MIEEPVALRFQPGLFRNGTKYQAKNRWYDANLVRWFEDAILPVGGWNPVYDNSSSPVALTVLGYARGAHAWEGDDASAWLAIGTIDSTTTSTRLYGYANGLLTDITPVGLPAGAVDGGIDSSVDSGSAYGSGAYGLGLYSSGTGARTIDEADTWSLDNFGEFLLAVMSSDETLYAWDRNIANDASVVTSAPTLHAVVVTPEHFVMALGADGDVRQVMWSDQNSYTQWTPAEDTLAGDEVLSTDGRLIAGARLRRNTLIWSTVDVHTATYVGGDFIYRFDQVGANCGLFAPNAWALAGNAAYWMSDKKFFKYDGAVQELRCDVSDDIFNDLNVTQRAKVFAFPLPQYNEVWWFFPSASQTGLENDRYVVYNYGENHWYVGRLARSSGVGRGVFDTPILIETAPDGGGIFQHESGLDYADEGTPFAESGPTEIGDGKILARVQELIPDERHLGELEVTFFVSNSPTGTETSYGPYALTDPTPVRFTARQVRMRFTQAVDETSWRLGVMKVGILPAGKR